MKPKRDIFDLFRDNADKLESPPSPQAWQRLERRLNQKRPSQRRTLRSLGWGRIAAALAFLLVAIFAMSILLQNNAQEEKANLAYKTVALEDLPNINVASEAMFQAVKVSYEQEGRYYQALEEGSPEKRIPIARIDEVELTTSSQSTPSNMPINQSIEQFRWLLGKWSGPLLEGQQKVTWSQPSADRLLQQAFVERNGVSTYVETIEIQQNQSGLFYLMDNTGQGQIQRYRLVEINESRAIFENTTVDFPQQVILQFFNQEQYATIFRQSTAKEAGFSMDQLALQQEQFFSIRNFIASNQVMRNLKRL